MMYQILRQSKANTPMFDVGALEGAAGALEGAAGAAVLYEYIASHVKGET
jgi:hypothetical protein